MSHVDSSEAGMTVHRVVRIFYSDNGLVVQVRWKGSLESEDSFESVFKVYGNVPGLLKKLLLRKNTPSDSVAKVFRALSL